MSPHGVSPCSGRETRYYYCYKLCQLLYTAWWLQGAKQPLAYGLMDFVRLPLSDILSQTDIKEVTAMSLWNAMYCVCWTEGLCSLQIHNIGKLMGYRGQRIKHISSVTGCFIFVTRGRPENKPVPIEIYSDNQLDLSEAVRLVAESIEVRNEV